MKFTAHLLAICMFIISSNAYAKEDKTSYISLAIGYYDILDNDEAIDFRLEYRSGNKYWWEIKPWAGIEVTSDASIWAGGGILADIEIADQLYLIPNIGAGLYAKGSSNLDLGSALEFRSQIEMAYELEGNDRVGISFSHTSNSSLSDKNPGTEVLSLYYHIPY